MWFRIAGLNSAIQNDEFWRISNQNTQNKFRTICMICHPILVQGRTGAIGRSDQCYRKGTNNNERVPSAYVISPSRIPSDERLPTYLWSPSVARDPFFAKNTPVLTSVRNCRYAPAMSADDGCENGRWPVQISLPGCPGVPREKVCTGAFHGACHSLRSCHERPDLT